MAEILVTKDFLDSTVTTLTEELSVLKDAADKIDLLIGKDGFTIYKAPPIKDALASIIELAGEVHSRMKIAGLGAQHGTPVKIERNERRNKPKAREAQH